MNWKGKRKEKVKEKGSTKKKKRKKVSFALNELCCSCNNKKKLVHRNK